MSCIFRGAKISSRKKSPKRLPDTTSTTAPRTSAEAPYCQRLPGAKARGTRPMRLAKSTVPVSSPRAWPACTSAHRACIRVSA